MTDMPQTTTTTTTKTLMSMLFVVLLCVSGIPASWAFVPSSLEHNPAVQSRQATTTARPLEKTTTHLYALFGTRPDDQDRRHNSTSLSASLGRHSDELDDSSSSLRRSPTNGAAAPSTSLGRTPPPVYREDTLNNPSGIGGQGGVSYNVNALKRNLLQETVRAYKMELLALLQSPSATEHVICEKLAALVQASPVRTTTDSNLLEADGVQWTLCYQSKYSTVAQLKRPFQPAAVGRNNNNNNNSNNRPTPTSPAHRRVGGKEFSFTRSAQRSFHLESVPDHQDPYVMERETYWGGLVRNKRVYAIRSLTRTSLQLQLQSSARRILGRPQRTTPPPPRPTGSTSSSLLDMSIIYCDTDLCIIADPQQRTYQVYTQADAWESTQLGRKVRFLAATLWYRLSHVMGNGGGSESDSSTTATGNDLRRQRSNDRLLRQVRTHQDLLDEESRLIVWQLGAGDDDDEAWESRKDPFVHLSADERQRLIKAMSVRQVRQAGQDYVSYTRRRGLLDFSWLPLPRRRTRFQKSDRLRDDQDSSSQRPRSNFRGPNQT